MANQRVINVPDIPNIGAKIRTGVVIVLGLIALAAINGLWYSVPAESEAVRLRFGKIVEKDIKPGLHFKLPFGIDSVDVEPVQRQLKAEFGYSTPGGTNPNQYSNRIESELVKNMVTGDRNAANVEWVVQYRIADLENYLYRVREAGDTLRDLSESVMREVIGDRIVDEVLTVGRREIEVECRSKLNEICTQYSLGLEVDLVQLTEVGPPPAVRASFEEVNRAQQEKEQAINVARGAYNRVVPQARGKADQAVSEAEGFSLKRKNEATGDATRFTAVYNAYRAAPEVTRQRLYLETLTDILPNLGPKVVLDESAANVLPFLPLQTQGVAPARPAATQPRSSTPTR